MSSVEKHWLGVTPPCQSQKAFHVNFMSRSCIFFFLLLCFVYFLFMSKFIKNYEIKYYCRMLIMLLGRSRNKNLKVSTPSRLLSCYARHTVTVSLFHVTSVFALKVRCFNKLALPTKQTTSQHMPLVPGRQH